MFRVLLAAAVLAPTLAIAQEVEPTIELQTIRYKEREELIFDSVEVYGEIVKPSTKFIVTPSRQRFNPLIKIRSSFDGEMATSVDQVK